MCGPQGGSCHPVTVLYVCDYFLAGSAGLAGAGAGAAGVAGLAAGAAGAVTAGLAAGAVALGFRV